MSLLTGHLFRDDAVVALTEPEPLDALPRVDPPHEWMISTALAVLLASLAGWCVLGSVERNVWTDGTFAGDGGGALAVTARVTARQAGRLSAGMPGWVLAPAGQGPPASAVVVEVAAAPGSGHDRSGGAMTGLRLLVAEPRPWMAADATCGIRVPSGRARPIRVLFDAVFG